MSPLCGHSRYSCHYCADTCSHYSSFQVNVNTLNLCLDCYNFLSSDTQLEVKVHGTRPKNVLFLIHEVIESLIRDVYEGINYDYLMPCPDCQLKDVSLISTCPNLLIENCFNYNIYYIYYVYCHLE